MTIYSYNQEPPEEEVFDNEEGEVKELGNEFGSDLKQDKPFRLWQRWK